MIRYAILLTALAASLMSCTSVHYQLTTFAPPQDYTGEKPHIRHHEGVSIEYDFSGPGGLMGFLVHNRLGEDIFIDFSRSSLIINDISLPYHQGTSQALTEVEIPNVTYWNTSLSLRPASAATSGSMMGAVVMIPEGTRMHFQRVEIPVPLLPLEQRALANGTRQFHPAEREAQVGTVYRHRLAFIPKDPAGEPFFVEDAFVVSNNRLVSGADFRASRGRLARPEALTTAVGVEMIDDEASAAGCIFSILGSGLMFLLLMTDGAD